MSLNDDRPVLARGGKLTIVCARRANGSSPAREFIESLDMGDQGKLFAMFQRMADVGQISNRQKFKKLDGKIFEFKSYQIRMPCFRDGLQWVITHGFVKKRDRVPPAEIVRANAIMNEDLQRRR